MPGGFSIEIRSTPKSIEWILERSVVRIDQSSVRMARWDEDHVFRKVTEINHRRSDKMQDKRPELKSSLLINGAPW